MPLAVYWISLGENKKCFSVLTDPWKCNYNEQLLPGTFCFVGRVRWNGATNPVERTVCDDNGGKFQAPATAVAACRLNTTLRQYSSDYKFTQRLYSTQKTILLPTNEGEVKKNKTLERDPRVSSPFNLLFLIPAPSQNPIGTYAYL